MNARRERRTDRTLRIRLTDKEREVLDAAATKNGKPTSTWARDLILDAASKRLRKKLRQ